MLTIAPPLPPALVDIRFTASPAHRNWLVMLIRQCFSSSLRRKPGDRGVGMDDTGIVEQPGDAAEPPVGLGEQGAGALRGRDVGLDRGRLAAGGLDCLDHGRRPRRARIVVDRNRPAARAREPCRRRADAAARAGNHQNPAHHSPPLAAAAALSRISAEAEAIAIAATGKAFRAAHTSIPHRRCRRAAAPSAAGRTSRPPAAASDPRGSGW